VASRAVGKVSIDLISRLKDEKRRDPVFYSESGRRAKEKKLIIPRLTRTASCSNEKRVSLAGTADVCRVRFTFTFPTFSQRLIFVISESHSRTRNVIKIARDNGMTNYVASINIDSKLTTN
jgi:hypothetical protein